MVGIILFHVVMLLLAAGIATRVIPAAAVRTLLGYWHKSIGITTPSENRETAIALVWIGSSIVTVDGCLFLLVLIVKLSHSG